MIRTTPFERAFCPPFSYLFKQPKEYCKIFFSARRLNKVQKKMQKIENKYVHLSSVMKPLKRENGEFEKQFKIEESFLYGIDKEVYMGIGNERAS